MFVWIFNYVTFITWSLLDLKVSNLISTDGQSQCYLSRDGVNLLIGSNLILAPVPCAIPEWPIIVSYGCVAPKGFEPMTSGMLVQCSTN